MSSIRFVALPTAIVTALQAGSPDANGQTPERAISTCYKYILHCASSSLTYAAKVFFNAWRKFTFGFQFKSR